MFCWTRTKPADFAEILAELERARAPEPSEKVEPAATDGSTPSSQTKPDAPARSRNRLGRVLSGLDWFRLRGTRAKGAHAAEARTQEATAPQEAADQPAVPQSPVPRPPKSENEVIAEELGLMRPLATAELQQLRRDFAKRNHPDRCAPAQRPRAARRMSIANMLIDAALKQSQRRDDPGRVA